MVKEIVKDVDFLSKKCKPVRKGENISDIIQDLRDTATAYEETHDCVGLAANQIGYDKKAIVVRIHPHGNYKEDKLFWLVMVNPVITNTNREVIDSEEGCLSLEGTRTVKRYSGIMVVYRDAKGKMQSAEFYGLEACIVQHEIDHLQGKLI